jgi:hypothetical protein
VSLVAVVRETILGTLVSTRIASRITGIHNSVDVVPGIAGSATAAARNRNNSTYP